MATPDDATRLLAAVTADEQLKKTIGGEDASVKLLEGEEEEAYWLKIT